MAIQFNFWKRANCMADSHPIILSLHFTPMVLNSCNQFPWTFFHLWVPLTTWPSALTVLTNFIQPCLVAISSPEFLTGPPEWPLPHSCKLSFWVLSHLCTPLATILAMMTHHKADQIWSCRILWDLKSSGSNWELQAVGFLQDPREPWSITRDTLHANQTTGKDNSSTIGWSAMFSFHTHL